MPTAERMSVVLMKARNLNPPFSDWNIESRPISKSQKPRIYAGLAHNRRLMSQERRTRHFARSAEVSSPRLVLRAKCHVKRLFVQARFALKGLQATQPRQQRARLPAAVSEISPRSSPSGRYKTGPERAAGSQAYDGNGNKNLKKTVS